MRPLSTIALLSVILLIGVFGVFFMAHPEGEPHGYCPLGSVENTSCEKIANSLASLSFHMKSLLQPTIIPAAVALLAFAAALAFVLAVFSDANVPGPLSPLVLAPAVFAGATANRKIRAWLTIHEKRDPSPMAAVEA